MAVDVFISHAHADGELAGSVEKWLLGLWPGLNIYRSSPVDKKLPLQFIHDAWKARCVLFIATPDSVRRPMVISELSTGSNKCIVTALAGTTFEKVKELRDQDLYSGIELDKIVDVGCQAGWEKLASLVALALNRGLQISVLEGPPINSFKNNDKNLSTDDDLEASFLEEFTKFYLTPLGEYQSDERTEKLLTMIEEKVFEIARKNGEMIEPRRMPRLDHRARLLLIASCMPNEAMMTEVFKLFSKLVDSKLLYMLDVMTKRLEEPGIETENYRMAKRIAENIVAEKELNSQRRSMYSHH